MSKVVFEKLIFGTVPVPVNLIRICLHGDGCQKILYRYTWISSMVSVFDKTRCEAVWFECVYDSTDGRLGTGNSLITSTCGQ
jgi:hypothetical protein